MARLRRALAVPRAAAGLRGRCRARARAARAAGRARRPSRNRRPATCSSTPRPTAPRALDALSRALGIDAIVLGSDRPYAEPLQSARSAMRRPRRSGSTTRGVRSGTLRHDPDGGSRMTHSPRSTYPARAATPARGRPDPRRPAGPRPRPGRAALAGVVPRRPARALAAPPGVRRRQPGLRLAAPRRPRRRVAALLDPRERHRLPRPRHLLRCRRGRRAGRSSSTTSPWATRPSRPSSRRGQVFSFGPDHIHRLTVRRDAGRCRCTRTARRCGGWASTPSAPTGGCAGSRCPTPTSCGRSTE